MAYARASFVAVVVVAAALFVTAGCSKKDSQADPQNSTVANKICPIMKGEVDAKGQTVSWKGKTIGFCCPQCIPEWNKLTDAERTEKLAAIKNPD